MAEAVIIAQRNQKRALKLGQTWIVLSQHIQRWIEQLPFFVFVIRTDGGQQRQPFELGLALKDAITHQRAQRFARQEHWILTPVCLSQFKAVSTSAFSPWSSGLGLR